MSRTSVYKIIKKWKEFGMIADKLRPVRTPINVTNEIIDFNDKSMRDDDEISAPKFHLAFNKQFLVNFYLSKVNTYVRN